MTLTEFLYERIASERTRALQERPSWASDRVLGNCKLKMQIVAMLAEVEATDGEAAAVALYPLAYVARFMATPYADHPDYNEDWAWRP